MQTLIVRLRKYHFLHRSLIVKSPGNVIELVTRLASTAQPEQPPLMQTEERVHRQRGQVGRGEPVAGQADPTLEDQHLHPLRHQVGHECRQ